jgi:DNA-binding response OmpR family regulator
LKSVIKNYFKNQTVLIAEDHTETRELLVDILSDIFAEVISVKNGLECLDEVEYSKPDILVTDIRMPKFDGISSIEEIRKYNYSLPIIIISSFSDEEYLLKALNYNIQGYLLKPLDIDILENALVKIYNLKNSNSFEIAPDLEYDYENLQLIYNETKISLTYKENELLNILINKKGNVVLYNELEYELWEKNNEIMSFDSLRTLVRKLRNKIPIDIIKNVSKKGYKITI